MVRFTRTFPDNPASDEFITAYTREYHPCGYATKFTKEQLADGAVIVGVQRYASCE